MIDKKTVERIAELAKIEVNQEIDLTKQLFEIVEYIDKLKEVDIEGTRPWGLQQDSSKKLLREDVVKKDSSREDILKNAPSLSGDFFKIAKVIK